MGTLVGKRKQTIFKKRWFDITSWGMGGVGAGVNHTELLINKIANFKILNKIF